MIQAFWQNFLGHAPVWYKKIILACLIFNPLLLLVAGAYITGWVLVLEFIFTLGMALRCYPLQPGGLLVIEALLLGLTNVDTLRAELFTNFPVVLLLVFMVAGVYFMRDLLLLLCTRLLLQVRSNVLLAFLFSASAALMSAFLDALTVIAVIIGVGAGLYTIYHKAISNKHQDDKNHDISNDSEIEEINLQDLKNLRKFLRGLFMHTAVGTALGGVCTIVGEPQNLLIANQAGWNFMEFFIRMMPVTMPVLAVGLVTCVLLEHFRLFGYGNILPERVREVLAAFEVEASSKRTSKEYAAFFVQGTAIVLLVLSLAFHIAEVGLIGLMVIVIQTALNGTIEEHRIGLAFRESLPFVALLVVFFGVVSVIEDQHLFTPVIQLVLALSEEWQPVAFYVANGALSAISDNVFVAAVYIKEAKEALNGQVIDRELFDKLAIAINTGTNILSVATPNGQAAFLFLLTSSVAPLIRLSYGRMIWMAVPYTVLMGTTGFIAMLLFI